MISYLKNNIALGSPEASGLEVPQKNPETFV